MFRDTHLVIFKTSEKIIYPEGVIFFNLLKSSSKGFPFIPKYFVHLSFLHSLFIWLVIFFCKVLSNHLLTGGKHEKVLSKTFYIS